MKWSGQQERALKDVSSWINDRGRQVYYLAGFAGTGKTTLAQHLVRDLDGLVLFAAYTGKAASVLREKGCWNASTLHSLLYNVTDRDRSLLVEMEKRLAVLRQVELPVPRGLAEEERLEEEIKELEQSIQIEREKIKGPSFHLNPDSLASQASLIVLDECSMVNRDIAEDLLSFGKKVLVLGDPAQLPPVKGSGYFTNQKPDLTLTEIHRQALDNPIIRWSMKIREGGHIPFGEEGTCRKIRKGDINTDWLAEESITGQILSGKNETRRRINRNIRNVMEYSGTLPQSGEKLVMLRNDRDYDVLNGVICEAASDAEFDEDGDVVMDLLYEGRMIPSVPIDTKDFRAYEDPEAAGEWVDRNKLQLDFGYAITVHKSQGSQWETVTLCDDGFAKGRDEKLRRQWLYTAITRATTNLNIVA